MPTRITSLALAPLPPGQFLVAADLQVYFDVSQEERTAPDRFDPAQRRWQRRQSSGDYRKTNNLFNRLFSARACGTTLPEFVWHEGLSFWQFLPSYTWPAFFRAVELLDTVSRIIRETEPQLLRLFPVGDDTEEIWQGVIQALARGRKIPVAVMPASNPRPKKGQDRLRAWLQCLGVSTYQIQAVYRAILKQAGRLSARCQKGRAGDITGGKKLLFASVARNWVSLPGEGREYDEQFYPLLPALREAGWTDFLGIDCPYTPPWKIIPKLWSRIRAKEPGVRWNTFDAYGRATAAHNAAARRVFARQRQILQEDPEFLRDFQYAGVSLMPALSLELRHAFNHILPQCAGMLATAREMLRRERPDAVMLTYEQGPLQRALIIEAARAGVPTVGLQHGMVFDNHYDYMHSHIAADPVADPAGFAIPKISCVWGPSHKKNLTVAGSYPPEAVAVTGNWRYDRWAAAAEAADQAALRQRLGLPEGKRVVLILSAAQRTPEYLARCLEAVAGREECVPLIKLHPGADDPGPVREMLRRLSYPAATLFTGQLQEALLAADLVLSQWSTAISEAVLLEKPVVLVNFLLLNGPEAYVEAGVCLYVTRPAELPQAIATGLNNQQIRQRLSAAGHRFIEDFYFKVDGQSGRRVAAALEELD